MWGRFDETLVYKPLGSLELRRVAEILVAEASEALEGERGVSLEVLPAALDQLFERRVSDDGYSGARGLRRIVEGRVVDLAVHHLLERPEPPGTTLVIDCYQGILTIVNTRHRDLAAEREALELAEQQGEDSDEAAEPGSDDGQETQQELASKSVRGSGAIRSI